MSENERNPGWVDTKVMLSTTLRLSNFVAQHGHSYWHLDMQAGGCDHAVTYVLSNHHRRGKIIVGSFEASSIQVE
jgi:hypothetical protein